jgi:competence protein ComGD
LHHKGNGFTLIEMLLVLFIIMTIVTITFFHLRTSYEEKVIGQFLELFQEDIWLAQEYAISHSQSVELSFYNGQTFYDLRESGFRNLIYKRTFHSDLQIRPLTITNPIKFLPNGNINQPGTMYVLYNLNTYKVVFQLGRGRFYIEKL